MYLFAVTIVSGVIMFVLFVSELNYYLTKDIQQELFVDTSRGQKLKINIDVTLMKVGCMCKYLVLVKLCLFWLGSYFCKKFSCIFCWVITHKRCIFSVNTC